MEKSEKEKILRAIENDLIIDPIVSDVFEKYDINKNGVIDRKELETCMIDMFERVGNKRPTKEAVDKEFTRLDIDKNGVIDFKEFRKFVRKTLKDIIDSMY